MSQKLLEDLFQAYFDARKNKRNTLSVLQFEDKFESNIFDLYREIIANQYRPRKSICFTVDYPVKREIFAADFRDRIVHHLIFNYINPIFERFFINDSYSCRLGKGTLYGIKRIDHFIRSCSDNYKKDAYFLKLDISGYFMLMDKKILFKQVKERLLNPKVRSGINFDLFLILDLIEKTIFTDPTKDCILKARVSDWKNLSKNKSLFYSGSNRGLPIGNLTSQLFGNVYLHPLDCFIKYQQGFKYYGRYVDDFILVHQNKERLKEARRVIGCFLLKGLGLSLNQKKTQLKHFSQGIQFLGAYIKPNRIYVNHRTKNNFKNKLYYQNQDFKIRLKLDKEQVFDFVTSINSYLGLMRHFKTKKLRKNNLKKRLDIRLFNYFYLDLSYCKLNIRDKYKQI